MFTPGEKAVLGQIRVLYSSAAQRDQQIKTLTTQWPPSAYATYKSAFDALVAKQLIQDTGAQVFRITDAGLRAIGVAIPKPQPQLREVAQRRVVQPEVVKQPTKVRSGIRGALSRLARGLLGAGS
jgi:hypothetical protein